MVEINKRILNEAYEKFKLFIYYNELLTFNYSKIIDFDKNLDSRMDSLENALMGSEELWEEYKRKALKTVKWRAFPNKIYRSTEIINFNKNNEKLNINSFQDIEFYFESNIEVNIISVLWILFLGKKLDESFLENSYGNRIVREQKSRSDRYRLFNFSNKNYGAWKIEALERAEQLHKSEEDSIIINLNIFKLCNSINFQRENFYSYLDEIEFNDNNEFILSRLNEFIIEVIEIYNRKIMMKAKYNNIKRRKRR